MPKRILILIGSVILALATACSSTKDTKAGGGTTSAQSTTTPGPASSKAAGVAITASGDILTGPDGRTLYFNTVDTASKITCVDACAKEWPPVPGPASSVTGVDQSKFGTALRPDGTQQVSFDGHPLYMFDEDKKAGDLKGEGIDDEGGKWHVATSSGTPVSPGNSSAPPNGGGSRTY